ncbi:sulfotransferase family protein [Rhodovulum sp. BSW8]|uniref:tetratricopeptide repeat-containing sulfotransferase family protein n=1 Tax=Rhodovulum sp. BSW8 TaxID=2259645 RepID=UPI000DE2C610|nr:tetratricopeptide repeat-containing sulfotransferase family protein [Rhodovulum sp. BSW8]RBO53309.1 sulfotransferase family protein [Rhodovulum sp. BSW8]
MLPLSQTETKRRFDEAQRLQRTGRIEAAEAAYRALLDGQPGLAEAAVQLGRIALARGAADEAAARFETARKARPAEAAIWQMEAEALARLGDPARTTRFLKAARKAGLPTALLSTLEARLAPAKGGRPRAPLGSAPPQAAEAVLAALRAGRPGEAERRAEALTREHPDSAVAFALLAAARVDQGKTAAARASFEAGLALAPDYPELRSGLGRLLVRTGDVAAGVRHLEAALARAPKNPLTLAALGEGLARLGRKAEAEAALRRAVAAEPRYLDGHLALAHLLMEAGDPEAAEKVLEAAMAAGHDRAIVRVRLAEAQAKQGRTETARASFDGAIAAEPGLALAYSLRGMLLQTLGEFAAAEADFRQAIALEPRNGEHYRTMLATYKVTPEDPLLARMETLFADPALGDESRMHLGFALSRAMEQIKAHDRVFTYLRPANDLMRARHPYDIAERRAEIDAAMAAFEGTDFSGRKIEGAAEYAPIFVTGMPRSGTTLVEQIVASHSRVTGGGEIAYVAAEAMKLLQDGADGLRPLDRIGDAEIAALGHRIETEFRSRFPGSDLVSDKSIQTYMVAGLVRLALPRARIVVVHRDPRDICLSIYKNMFAEGTHRYATKLRDLGLYYRMFLEMIEFWRRKLPGGLYEIRYEDLIADPETQARALVAACGLDWQENCLNFHKTERRVATLSLAQVRQPIYATSMKAWQRHADELAELTEALGDAIGDDNGA